MKTILKLSVALALFFSTATGMATEPKIQCITNGVVKSVIFELDSQSRETVFRLFDSEDHQIYAAHLPEGRYVKKFDLTKLKAGLYFFSIQNPIKDILFTLDIDKTDVKLIEKKEKIKPVFRKVEELLYLNFLNLDLKAVEIRVYDSSNNVLFKETFASELCVEKAFNFENAFEDTYTVAVKINGKMYTEYVVVD